MDSIPNEVAAIMKWYVYRLIDPRSGQTFYVGKGKGSRVFDHVKGARTLGEEDAEDLKSDQIRRIHDANLEVIHVIHRHGIDTENVAYEVEAALIDAYQGLTNKVAGQGSDDFGCRHVDQIVRAFRSEVFQIGEPLLLISINRTYELYGDAYEAVRAAWKIDINRVADYKLVLASEGGIVRAAFRPSQWLPATRTNFGARVDGDRPGRYGFVGVPAEPETAALYVGKRHKDRAYGSPVRFLRPDS